MDSWPQSNQGMGLAIMFWIVVFLVAIMWMGGCADDGPPKPCDRGCQIRKMSYECEIRTAGDVAYLNCLDRLLPLITDSIPLPDTTTTGEVSG